jgi:hypothetical protein
MQQYHAVYDPKKYIAGFMSHHYKGPSIQILEGICRKCLKHGKPVIYKLATHPWSRLLEEDIIDPYQAASVFFPGSKFHMAHFKKPILNLKAPELPCKYPATCEQTCMICSSFIDGPGMELKEWPGFKVHAQCTSRCQSINCPARLPDFPAYISYQRSQFMCEEHQLTGGFQRMSLGAITPPLVSQAKKQIVESPKTPKPVSLSSPKKSALRPPLHPSSPHATTTTTPATPPTTPRKAEECTPQIKKTVQFKKLGKAKADKFDGDRSQCIKSFFSAPAKATKAPQPEQPRRFIRNKFGTIYAYWKGENAHCIETDKVLFKANFTSRNVSGKQVYAPKFDFTPPKHFFPAEAHGDTVMTGAPAGGE